MDAPTSYIFNEIGYDANGNQTEKDAPSGREKWTYAWSSTNLLTEAKHYNSD